MTLFHTDTMDFPTNNAPTTAFDIATYTPPPRWQQDIKDGAVTYTALQEDHYCTIALYASTETSGDAQQDFMDGWKALVLEPSDAAAEPKMQTLQDDGRDVRMGTAAIKIQGVDMAVVLTSYSGFGKVFRVLVLMNSDFFQEDASAFLNGIVLAKTEAPTPPMDAGSFNDVYFTAPEGWAQQRYSNAITLQSPVLACGNDASFLLAVFNSEPFGGDLRRQAIDRTQKLYGTEGKMVWSTLPSGLEYIIASAVVSNPAHFEAEVLLVKCENDVFAITLESNRTEYANWDAPLQCPELRSVWKQFIHSLHFKNEPPATISTEIPDALIGKWEYKILADSSGPIWTYNVMDEYVFRANGYVKNKKIFQNDEEGTFAVKGNQLTIVDPNGESETFAYRLEKDFGMGATYLYLTDKNEEETKLIFKG